jgi:polyhydroxyalkanoate synthesis regulator phasin
MGRAKEEPRGRLAALQGMLAGGGKALVDQAQALRDGIQTRLTDVGGQLEGQLATLVGAVEKRLSVHIDDLLSSLAVSLRRDVERVRERLRAIENRLADVPKEGFRELILPLQTVANGAAERASGAAARVDELALRVQTAERHVADIARDTTRETLDADEFRQRLERIEQRLTDVGREVGTKLGELGALRERLTRLESRVVDSSKDQITRAGEAAGFRDRLTRLEARLSDLSKEQLARAVETAGLRERVFRIEQRSNGQTASGGAAAPVIGVPVED